VITAQNARDLMHISGGIAASTDDIDKSIMRAATAGFSEVLIIAEYDSLRTSILNMNGFEVTSFGHYSDYQLFKVTWYVAPTD